MSERIPLSPKPSFTFRVTVDGYSVAFRLLYAEEPAQWFVGVDCEAVGLSVHGLALVTGRGLLQGHSIKELGDFMLIDRLGDADPDYDGLGDRWILYYFTRAEVHGS